MISSASTSGESEPITSTSSWVNWRKRPACGRSWRNSGPYHHSFTGWGSFYAPGEELGVLEDGGLDPRVAGPLQERTGHTLDPRAGRGVRGKHVRRPAGGLEAIGHDGRELIQCLLLIGAPRPTAPARRGRGWWRARRRAS